MTAADIPAVLALWRASPGVDLNESDIAPGIAAFLERNPGLSAVARVEETLAGAVLCGHDGRRGYLHHLAVAPRHRRIGIAAALLRHGLSRLAPLGILKCNVFVLEDNAEGASFWRHADFAERLDFRVFQRRLPEAGR